MRTLFTFLIIAGLATAGCSAASSDAPAKTQANAVALPAADRVPADSVVRAQTAPAASSEDDRPAIPASAVAENKPASAAAQFDAALVRLSQGQPAEPMSSLPPEERDLISSVLDAITGFRHGLAEQGALLSAKTAPLVALSDQLRSQAPLSVPTLALCRSVTQFGVYDPIDPPRFTAGKESPVIVYCELDNFRSHPSSDGRWETKLSYEAVLYTDGDTSISVINKKPTSIVDLCRKQRRDFFLADRITLPATLPVGKYLLKVTVVDQLANHVAEKTLALMIAPN